MLSSKERRLHWDYGSKSLILRINENSTAGSEEYDQLRPLSYPDTHIFVIVFAINSETSLLNVEKKWVPEVRQHTDGSRNFSLSLTFHSSIYCRRK